MILSCWIIDLKLIIFRTSSSPSNRNNSMKKLFPLSIAVASMFLLFGCKYSNIEYMPQPGTITGKEQAKAIILKTLSEQPRKNGATQLTVNDECITFAEDRRNLISGGSLNSGMAIYYNRPDQLNLISRRGKIFYVDLLKNKILIYKVTCFTEADAKQFIDAFKYMQNLNASPAPVIPTGLTAPAAQSIPSVPAPPADSF